MESYDTLVQVLRCCGDANTSCSECPWDKYVFGVCFEKLLSDAADAIETLLSTNAWNEEAAKHLKGEVDKVVHCKDCKWYSIYEAKKDGTPDKRYSPSVCLRGTYAKRRDPEWFCADGERNKENDE